MARLHLIVVMSWLVLVVASQSHAQDATTYAVQAANSLQSFAQTFQFDAGSETFPFFKSGSLVTSDIDVEVMVTRYVPEQRTRTFQIGNRQFEITYTAYVKQTTTELVTIPGATGTWYACTFGARTWWGVFRIEDGVLISECGTTTNGALTGTLLLLGAGQGSGGTYQLTGQSTESDPN